MSSLGLHLLHGACPLTWLFNLSALILHTKTLLKRKKKKKTHFTNEDIEAPES